MSVGRGKGKSAKARDDCSDSAFESVDRDSQAWRVFEFVKEKQMTTCDSAELALNLSHQSCSATFNYLCKKGLIEKSGQVGTTRYGRKANLYRPVVRDTLFPLS